MPGKIVFDGNKVMKLSELMNFAQKQERKPSPFDVYRDMFTVEIDNDGRNDYMRIRIEDDNSYQKPITLRQAVWYNGVKPDDREDVTLTIAATMFPEEILMAYLTQRPIHNFKNNMKSVNAVKKKYGRFALRITMNDGMPIPIIPMDSQNESYFRRLSPDDRQGYLLNLAIHYLIREDVRAIIQRIRQTTKDQTGVRVLSHPQDFTKRDRQRLCAKFCESPFMFQRQYRAWREPRMGSR